MNKAAQPGQRLSTGNPELDTIINGGLMRDRLYLVEGTPGTGKTTLAIQFVMEGARRGEKTLYITLGETREELVATATSHGWELDGIDIYELVPLEAQLDRQQTVLQPSEVELGETMQLVCERISAARARSAGNRLAVRTAPLGTRPAAFPASDPRAEVVPHRAQLHDLDPRRSDGIACRPAAAQHRARRHHARTVAPRVRRGAPPPPHLEVARLRLPERVPRFPDRAGPVHGVSEPDCRGASGRDTA